MRKRSWPGMKLRARSRYGARSSGKSRPMPPSAPGRCASCSSGAFRLTPFGLRCERSRILTFRMNPERSEPILSGCRVALRQQIFPYSLHRIVRQLQACHEPGDFIGSAGRVAASATHVAGFDASGGIEFEKAKFERILSVVHGFLILLRVFAGAGCGFLR